MPTFPAADTILTNGDILTVDAAFGTVGALAIRDGRILATGSDAAIAALAGPGTRRIDLVGRTVLPGLIDAHCHLLTTGLLLGEVVLHDCRTIPEVPARVAVSWPFTSSSLIFWQSLRESAKISSRME